MAWCQVNRHSRAHSVNAGGTCLKKAMPQGPCGKTIDIVNGIDVRVTSCLGVSVGGGGRPEGTQTCRLTCFTRTTQ